MCIRRFSHANRAECGENGYNKSRFHSRAYSQRFRRIYSSALFSVKRAAEAQAFFVSFLKYLMIEILCQEKNVLQYIKETQISFFSPFRLFLQVFGSKEK